MSDLIDDAKIITRAKEQCEKDGHARHVQVRKPYGYLAPITNAAIKKSS